MKENWCYELAGQAEQSVLRWFGHMEKIVGSEVRGTP